MVHTFTAAMRGTGRFSDCQFDFSLQAAQIFRATGLMTTTNCAFPRYQRWVSSCPGSTAEVTPFGTWPANAYRPTRVTAPSPYHVRGVRYALSTAP